MKVNISAVHFVADIKLKELITEKVKKLERFYEQIIDVEIFLKLENAGQVKDKVVEMKVMLPGHILMAIAIDKSFEAAFDEANENIKRQLTKTKEKLRSY